MNCRNKASGHTLRRPSNGLRCGASPRSPPARLKIGIGRNGNCSQRLPSRGSQFAIHFRDRPGLRFSKMWIGAGRMQASIPILASRHIVKIVTCRAKSAVQPISTASNSRAFALPPPSFLAAGRGVLGRRCQLRPQRKDRARWPTPPQQTPRWTKWPGRLRNRSGRRQKRGNPPIQCR